MIDIRIKTIPHSRKEFVEEKEDGRFVVAVKAPQEEGKANARLCVLLARHFSVPLEDIRIIRGKTQSSKLVRVQR
jgi:uncharacterized protein (TIGR00251 family)